MGDVFTRGDLTVACMLAPLLGHPPDDVFQLEPGLRAVFGIATPEEPYFEPLRRWRDAMYRRLVAILQWYVPWCVIIDVIVGVGLALIWRRDGLI